MNNVKEFEKGVIRKLCESHVSPELLEELFEESDADYEYSGAGYFITFKHLELPADRIVCDSPKLSGKWNGIDSGFIVFLGNCELKREHGVSSRIVARVVMS